MNASAPQGGQSIGPLWTPTVTVERMKRDCEADPATPVPVDREIFIGLLFDSLEFRRLATPHAPGSCNWVEDSDGIWATACGNAFELDAMAGPPAEQGLKFCGYCGKHLVGFSYKDPDDEFADDDDQEGLRL